MTGDDDACQALPKQESSRHRQESDRVYADAPCRKIANYRNQETCSDWDGTESPDPLCSDHVSKAPQDEAKGEGRKSGEDQDTPQHAFDVHRKHECVPARLMVWSCTRVRSEHNPINS